MDFLTASVQHRPIANKLCVRTETYVCPAEDRHMSPNTKPVYGVRRALNLSEPLRSLTALMTLILFISDIINISDVSGSDLRGNRIAFQLSNSFVNPIMGGLVHGMFF